MMAALPQRGYWKLKYLPFQQVEGAGGKDLLPGAANPKQGGHYSSLHFPHHDWSYNEGLTAEVKAYCVHQLFPAMNAGVPVKPVAEFDEEDLGVLWGSRYAIVQGLANIHDYYARERSIHLEALQPTIRARDIHHFDWMDHPNPELAEIELSWNERSPNTILEGLPVEWVYVDGEGPFPAWYRATPAARPSSIMEEAAWTRPSKRMRMDPDCHPGFRFARALQEFPGLLGEGIYSPPMLESFKEVVLEESEMMESPLQVFPIKTSLRRIWNRPSEEGEVMEWTAPVVPFIEPRRPPRGMSEYLMTGTDEI